MNRKKYEKHGMRNTHIYNVWKEMRYRCSNPNHSDFKYYGGRGITVCDRWNNSFIAFYKDMVLTYKKGLTIERKDNDGNYEPTNCCWINHKQQMNNRRAPKLTKENIIDIRQLLHEGRLTQIEIGKLFNVANTMISRIKTGKRWKNK